MAGRNASKAAMMIKPNASNRISDWEGAADEKTPGNFVKVATWLLKVALRSKSAANPPNRGGVAV